MHPSPRADTSKPSGPSFTLGMTGRSLVDVIMIEEMFWDQTQELIFAGLACWMAQHLLPVNPSGNSPPSKIVHQNSWLKNNKNVEHWSTIMQSRYGIWIKGVGTRVSCLGSFFCCFFCISCVYSLGNKLGFIGSFLWNPPRSQKQKCTCVTSRACPSLNLHLPNFTHSS